MESRALVPLGSQYEDFFSVIYDCKWELTVDYSV